MGVHPRGLTLAQLWVMAHGKRQESRTLAAQQAALVWLLTGEDGVDVEGYIKTGTLAAGGRKVNFGSIPGVAEKIEQIHRDGRLIL